MRLSFGGKIYIYPSPIEVATRSTNDFLRVTSLLGESFKIHSHTLALNDDAGLTLSSSASSPSSSPEMDEDMGSELD